MFDLIQTSNDIPYEITLGFIFSTEQSAMHLTKYLDIKPEYTLIYVAIFVCLAYDWYDFFWLPLEMYGEILIKLPLSILSVTSVVFLIFVAVIFLL